MSLLRTRTSVVPASAGTVAARVPQVDRLQHPLNTLPQRTVYAGGYSALGKAHPRVKVRTDK